VWGRGSGEEGRGGGVASSPHGRRSLAEQGGRARIIKPAPARVPCPRPRAHFPPSLVQAIRSQIAQRLGGADAPNPRRRPFVAPYRHGGDDGRDDAGALGDGGAAGAAAAAAANDGGGGGARKRSRQQSGGGGGDWELDEDDSAISGGYSHYDSRDGGGAGRQPSPPRGGRGDSALPSRAPRAGTPHSDASSVLPVTFRVNKGLGSDEGEGSIGSIDGDSIGNGAGEDDFFY